MRQIRGVLLSALAMVAAGEAIAQSGYPEKAIRILVGFPAGSTVDVAARILGPKLAEAMGKPVVVDNVAGVAGNIAADRVAKAAADGHTLGLATNSQITVNPSLYPLPYDPIRDLVPVSQVYVSANVLVVHNSVPAKTLNELIVLAKQQPGALTYASGGGGSSPHVAGEMLKSVARLDIRHVPYKGVVAAVPDLIAGRVNMMFAPTVVVLPGVRDGRLRALAVTSLKRASALPNLPTIDESGFPGFEVTLWGGVVAPAGTPAAIVRKLYSETVRALALADVRSKLAEGGMEVVGSTPEEFAAVIRAEIPKWASLFREAGIKAD
jgi:tripartite-type tricarboxylate transporter receptor subunit TctC